MKILKIREIVLVFSFSFIAEAPGLWDAHSFVMYWTLKTLTSLNLKYYFHSAFIPLDFHSVLEMGCE